MLVYDFEFQDSR